VKVLFLLTARGGSKGVPRKNLRKIGGLSLIGYKIRGARKSRYCDWLIVSTEDEEIREEAVSHGATVPFVRPLELASDTATSADVVYHAMRWIEDNSDRRFDAVMLLEPTAPFTRPSDYDGAIQLMEARGANLVVGLRETEVASTFVGPMESGSSIRSIVEKVIKARNLRRQDQPPEYTMNAALYLFRWDYFMKHRQVYADPDTSFGYAMPPEHSIEIDTPLDLAWAEFLVAGGHLEMTTWREQGGDE
jgi:CMP-N-acetylneuraminic acid synthetase